MVSDCVSCSSSKSVAIVFFLGLTIALASVKNLVIVNMQWLTFNFFGSSNRREIKSRNFEDLCHGWVVALICSANWPIYNMLFSALTLACNKQNIMLIILLSLNDVPLHDFLTQSVQPFCHILYIFLYTSSI